MGFAKIEIGSAFRREYMSVSSIKLAEKCLLAYKLRYIDGIRHSFAGVAAAFGKLLHKALELIYRWVEQEEHSGAVPQEILISKYREAFEQGEVSGEALYKEGIDIVRDYFRVHDHVEHGELMAIERDFRIVVEADDGSVSYEVLGIIDRVDRVGPTAIRVNDYKINRMLFTREELDTDLQMSVYGLAVRTIWPWADSIEYSFDMLRHNIRQHTSRSEEDLNMAADYIIAMTRRLESLRSFPPRLNFLCPWCDDREMCREYSDALQKGETTLSYLVAANDIGRVAAERDRCDALEKIAKTRKAEMDEIILAHLLQMTDDSKLQVGDTCYSISQGFNTDWPADKTARVLADGLGIPEEIVRSRILVVQKGLIDDLVKNAKLSSAKTQLLRAKLDHLARKSAKRPYVSAKDVKQRKG